METIYGSSTTHDRVAKDSMQPNQQVSLSHDYYSSNPEASKKKMSEVEDAKKPSGYEVGYSGKMKETGKDYRVRKAIGGVAKLRQHFPGA